MSVGGSWFFSCLATVAVLSACDGGKVVSREETRTLDPARTGWWSTQVYSYPANDTAWPCPLDRGGLGPTSPAAGRVQAGYEHSYDPGTRPFPCSRRTVNVYRAAVKFDLVELQSKAPRVFVKNATLHFRKMSATRDCADKFLTGTEDWTVAGFAKLPHAEVIYDLPVPSNTSLACSGLGGFCAMNVTGQVNDWVLTKTSNHGFVVMGENEDLSARDNNACRTEYGEFSMSVHFTYEQALIFPVDPEKVP